MLHLNWQKEEQSRMHKSVAFDAVVGYDLLVEKTLRASSDWGLIVTRLERCCKPTVLLHCGEHVATC